MNKNKEADIDRPTTIHPRTRSSIPTYLDQVFFGPSFPQ